MAEQDDCGASRALHAACRGYSLLPAYDAQRKPSSAQSPSNCSGHAHGVPGTVGHQRPLTPRRHGGLLTLSAARRPPAARVPPG